MSNSTTNVHRVKSISVRATPLGVGSNAFISTEVLFTTEDGSQISFSGFSKDYLQIEGADLVNAVASGEEEPA